MKKCLISLLLTGLIIVSSVTLFLSFSRAQSSGTDINEIIYSNTTWTQAESPYTFTGPVAIYAGVTLTIQAGVTVNIGSYYLQVNGTLNATGNSTNPIFINGDVSSVMPDYLNQGITFYPSSSSWNNQSATGCILKNAVLTTVPIQVVDSSPNISFNNSTFENSSAYGAVITIIGGSPTISNNVIFANGSRFIIAQDGGGIIVDSGDPLISSNSVGCVDCFDGNGIVANGNSTVINNTVFNWEYGIQTAANSIIGRNLLLNNEESGIAISGNSSIQNNAIIDNPDGVLFDSPSSSLVSENNIYGNLYNCYLNAAITDNVDVTNNWWGTIDSSLINQTIYDFKDNFNVGNATFIPFLESPDTQAPTYINATAGSGGSISPSGVISTNYGGNQSFIITPNAGYSITGVLVNGTSVGAVNSYTIKNINGATTISATFALTPTPTPTASPTSALTQTPTGNSGPNPTSQPTSTPTQNNNNNSSPSPTPAIPEFPSAMLLSLVAICTLAAAFHIARKRHNTSK